MGKEMNATKQRDNFLEKLRPVITEVFDSDVFYVGSGILAMPGVDEDGNEFFYKIQVSIPRGRRNGEGGYEPWDAYADKEEYDFKISEAAAKKAAKEEKARKAADEKARKKKAKETIKELNKKGLDKMIHEGEGEGE